MRIKNKINSLILFLGLSIGGLLMAFINPSIINAKSCMNDCVAVANVCALGNLNDSDGQNCKKGSSLGRAIVTVAQATNIDGSGQRIYDFINTALNILFSLVAFVCIGMVIVGGIQYSTSSGSPQATSDAKKKISNAVLALVLLIFIYPFLQWVVPGGIF